MNKKGLHLFILFPLHKYVESTVISYSPYFVSPKTFLSLFCSERSYVVRFFLCPISPTKVKKNKCFKLKLKVTTYTLISEIASKNMQQLVPNVVIFASPVEDCPLHNSHSQWLVDHKNSNQHLYIRR